MLKINSDFLEWSLKHIEKYGDTDIFPFPFEYQAIRDNWQSIKTFLLDQDILKWNTRPHRRCLTPKNRYGFRIATQLDPLDTMIFTALVAEIGDDIEKARIPKNHNIVFSHRFLLGDDGEMYDRKYNWEAFLDKCKYHISSNKFKYVVIADIADFYPRIYSHPLEDSLKMCTNKGAHVKAINKLLSSWNFSVSAGIPVGISASRLLAELTINDIDTSLLSEGAVHCRYVDDYRIFCKDEKEAYERLAFLANILYENHSLTLQQNKTTIMTAHQFDKQFIQSEREAELFNLTKNFRKILEEIGITNDPYQNIDYNLLPESIQKEIDKLNLVKILEEQIKSNSAMDLFVVRFALRRLSQIGNKDAIDLVLNNIDVLYLAFKDAIKYIQELKEINPKQKEKIGKTLLKIMENSLASHLEYHRLWILDIFSKNSEWDNESNFVKLYNTYQDEFSQRKLILAMGRANNFGWFKSNKRYINNYPIWKKRAFIAAASCLPGDEYSHWLRSIQAKLDPLEKAIGHWASNNPFK